nr:unnamed protein product [Callosobruchus chinensis]
MFVGGTNYGFLNGAQNFKYDDWDTDYHSITSSYDYLSPISEAGDLTEKYWITKELLAKYNPIRTKLPDVPPNPKKTAYANVKMNQELYLDDLLKTIEPTWSKNVVPMENLNINNNSGQSYGYIVYRKTQSMILVNGVLVSPWLQRSADLNKFGTSRILNSYVTLSDKELKDATIDIVVENWGQSQCWNIQTVERTMAGTGEAEWGISVRLGHIPIGIQGRMDQTSWKLAHEKHRQSWSCSI